MIASKLTPTGTMTVGASLLAIARIDRQQADSYREIDRRSEFTRDRTELIASKLAPTERLPVGASLLAINRIDRQQAGSYSDNYRRRELTRDKQK